MCVDAKWWNKVEFVMGWTKSKTIFVENMKTIAIQNGLILTIINLKDNCTIHFDITNTPNIASHGNNFNVHQLHLAQRMIVILLVHSLLLMKMPF
jgi:hypothetical protein